MNAKVGYLTAGMDVEINFHFRKDNIDSQKAYTDIRCSFTLGDHYIFSQQFILPSLRWRNTPIYVTTHARTYNIQSMPYTLKTSYRTRYTLKTEGNVVPEYCGATLLPRNSECGALSRAFCYRKPGPIYVSRTTK